MAYTKYSLTPANNTATPPDGAPEGMLPSAVNDTMRDMMAQIRDCGDGIRDGTYTMTAAKITGGTITGVAFTGNTFTSPVISGGSINNTPIGATTANTGAFTTLSATGVTTVQAGTVSAPAITTSGDTNTGIFFPAADTIAFSEGGVESMRIDSSGNVGINTSSPTQKLHVVGRMLGVQNATFNDTAAYGFSFQNASTSTLQLWGGYDSSVGGFIQATNVGVAHTNLLLNPNGGNVLIGSTAARVSAANRGDLEITGSSQAILALNTGTTNRAYLYSDATDLTLANIPAGAMIFVNNSTERMRITSGGNLVVGKTSLDTGVAGSMIYGAGVGVFTRSGDDCLILNRLANDGTLVGFYQDTVLEGTISVSGTTVSYNGGHLARWSQLPNNQKDDTLLKGTVLSNLDDMCVWTKDGEELPNEQLNKMKVSDVEGDTNVAGVFVNWTRDEQCNTDDMNVAMTGDMIIRIAQGVVVQKGDLLMSAGDGTAKPQGDDIVRSKTVAKVTSNHVTCTYDDGSYCVPCVLMAC